MGSAIGMQVTCTEQLTAYVSFEVNTSNVAECQYLWTTLYLFFCKKNYCVRARVFVVISVVSSYAVNTACFV